MAAHMGRVKMYNTVCYLMCLFPLLYHVYCICKAALQRVYLCELGKPFCYKLLCVVHMECLEVAGRKLGNLNL